MINRELFTAIRPLFILTFMVMVLLQSGCSYVQIVVSASSEAQLLRDGEKAYLLGNYQKAEELFSKVYNGDSDGQTKNTALYNLACTRMTIAKTPGDFKKAVDLLDEWKKPYHSGFYIENPTLVVTGLKKSNITLQAQSEKQGKELEKKRKEIKQLHQQTKNLRTLLQSYQEDNISAQEMIETLQHQITELEAIDQQLQEKKKPL